MNLLEYAASKCWALEEQTLHNLVGLLQRHVAGVRLDQEQVAAAVESRGRDRSRREFAVENGVARIPIRGVISKRASMVDDVSEPAGTSTLAISRQLNAAMKDEAVTAVLLEVDSPGGSVDGVHELAAEIRELRESKPIHAHIEGMGASAAYWLAAQANSVTASRGSRVGSIGVYATVIDDSEKAAKEGVAVRVVSSAPLKGIGTAGVPVTDEQISAVQDEVNETAGLFVEDVAEGREASQTKIRKLATGRTWMGPAALKNGLVDEVLPLRGALERVRAAAGVTGEQDPDAGVESAEKDESMEPKQATVSAPTCADDITQNYPAIANELIRMGAERERTRATAIRELAAVGQEALAADLIKSGKTVEEAQAALFDDLKAKHSSRMAQIRQTEPVGNAEDYEEVAQERAEQVGAHKTIEEQAAAAWGKSDELRQQYHDDFPGFLAVFKRDAKRAVALRK